MAFSTPGGELVATPPGQTSATGEVIGKEHEAFAGPTLLSKSGLRVSYWKHKGLFAKVAKDTPRPMAKRDEGFGIIVDA
jgi:hypothetical protein